MSKAVTPGPELLVEVRACFVRQGTTLNKWCNENGITYSCARQALIGSWSGIKGSAAKKKICNAAMLQQQTNPKSEKRTYCWVSTSQIAKAIGVTRQAVNRQATKNGWNHRPRRGQGGGKEFRIVDLPEKVIKALWATAECDDE